MASGCSTVLEHLAHKHMCKGLTLAALRAKKYCSNKLISHQACLRMASSFCTVVEHSTHKPKIGGLDSAAGTKREKV